MCPGRLVPLVRSSSEPQRGGRPTPLRAPRSSCSATSGGPSGATRAGAGARTCGHPDRCRAERCVPAPESHAMHTRPGRSTAPRPPGSTRSTRPRLVHRGPPHTDAHHTRRLPRTSRPRGSPRHRCARPPEPPACAANPARPTHAAPPRRPQSHCECDTRSVNSTVTRRDRGGASLSVAMTRHDDNRPPRRIGSSRPNQEHRRTSATPSSGDAPRRGIRKRPDAVHTLAPIPWHAPRDEVCGWITGGGGPSRPADR